MSHYKTEISRHRKGSGLIFFSQTNSEDKFLELFSIYFVEKITFIRWFYKVADVSSSKFSLDPDLDSQANVISGVCKKLIQFFFPFASEFERR
jgi:hypothetical protein